MTTDIAPLDTDYAAEPDAGLGALMTSRGNLPLDAVDITAAIAGTSASVELTQGFRNPFDVPLEATYVFPLPDRAAVTAMRMECAGHVVEGVLKERSRARQDYDQAIAEGRRAAIAEEDRPDVFTMRVGNIVPGERVTVRLTLAQPLPYEDGEVTFRFPLVVAPRYIPGRPLGDAPAGSGVAADTDAVPDASRISPPVLLPGFPNPVRLTVSADIDPAGLALAGIRCSVPARAEQAEGHTIVRLRPGERLDRDFILRLALADHAEIATSLVLTADPEDPAEGTFTLTIVPPDGEGRPRPRDVVLVLDRSGSMSGWKMVAARRAAARIVDTLTGADRFAVLCFDHVVEQVPDGLAGATDRNRFRAVEGLARTDARGGTEMLAPLERAVGMLTGTAEPQNTGAAEHRDRVLVLITDGQVGNEDQILNRIGPLLAGIRVHCVGIDQAVNAGFLSRLAAAGRGRCELVESEDRLDEAAARIHRRIGAPLVTALTLAPDGLQIVPGTTAPGLIPDLFPGVAVTLTGRWRGHPGGAITMRGGGADGTPFEHKVSAAVGGNPACTAGWARAHLRDLEDRYACLAGYGPARNSRGRNGRGRNGPGRAGPAGAPDHGRLAAVRRAVPVHGVRGRRRACRHPRGSAAPGDPARRAACRMGPGGPRPDAHGRGRGLAERYGSTCNARARNAWACNAWARDARARSGDADGRTACRHDEGGYQRGIHGADGGPCGHRPARRRGAADPAGPQADGRRGRRATGGARRARGRACPAAGRSGHPDRCAARLARRGSGGRRPAHPAGRAGPQAPRVRQAGGAARRRTRRALR